MGGQNFPGTVAKVKRIGCLHEVVGQGNGIAVTGESEGFAGTGRADGEAENETDYRAREGCGENKQGDHAAPPGRSVSLSPLVGEGLELMVVAM